ncbi:hypothetical protein FRB99_001923, partial [Tulasnella sp. 403]
ELFNFSGNSGEECEDFIQNVRRHAFSQGKLKDKEWVALFASTCFSGRALRWYARLDDPTKESWDLLQAALLEEWPNRDSAPSKPSVSRDTSTASIITPPAAPPPRLINKGGDDRPFVGGSQPVTTRRGRVQVRAKGVVKPGYLKFVSRNGRFHASFTDQRDSADHFELTGKQLSYLAAENKLLLAITWPRPPTGFVGSSDWGWIKVVETHTESLYTNVWEVGLGNKLFAVVDQHKLTISSTLERQVSPPFSLVTDMTGLTIYADHDHYVKAFGVSRNEFLLTLTFEDA